MENPRPIALVRINHAGIKDEKEHKKFFKGITKGVRRKLELDYCVVIEAKIVQDESEEGITIEVIK